MRRQLVWICVLTLIVIAGRAETARADVCIRIDTAHDTLSPVERTAARRMLANALEREGVRVVDGACDTPYVLAHARLGDTIGVTLDGPFGHREGTAIGADDLPHLYSQMARSIVLNAPIGSVRVIDRTNVTRAQDLPPRRLASDRFGYARLGYASVFADGTYGAPAFGFGYRAEFDHVAADVSFFNYALSNSGSSYYGSYRNATVGSLLKLEGLYFPNPTANASPYFGGGMSWGGTDVSHGTTYWSGMGLQGELTAGYELGRASSVKIFLQADAILPFYRVQSTTYTYQRTPNGTYASTYSTADRYAPSLVVAVGLGWQKGRQ